MVKGDSDSTDPGNERDHISLSHIFSLLTPLHLKFFTFYKVKANFWCFPTHCPLSTLLSLNRISLVKQSELGLQRSVFSLDLSEQTQTTKFFEPAMALSSYPVSDNVLTPKETRRQ